MTDRRRSPVDAGSEESAAPPGAAPTEGDPGVELDGVSVAFDGVTALDGVSISVREGEFFTLVGPSGCGKTTTLRAIAGFEEPTAGRVRIGGADVTGVPPEERHVGVVFQSYALFPHMSVRENVAYGLRFRDPPGGVSRRERVDELLSLVDLDGMGGRDPDQLSGGQQQRVALARALAPGPEVLLLDEPLSALDARLRERLRVTVRDVQRELGITTVYVTHDQAEALAISDRVAVVNGGRIEQVAPPEAVYREPASRFVAEFVGDNNLLDGEVTATDPTRVAVRDAEFRLPADAGERPRGGEAADAGDANGALRVGDAVTLCIRPEAIELVGESAAGDGGRLGSETADDRRAATTVEATVEGVEFLGDAYRVRCRWAGRTLLVKAAARSAPEGRVRLRIDARDAHLLR